MEGRGQLYAPVTLTTPGTDLVVQFVQNRPVPYLNRIQAVHPIAMHFIHLAIPTHKVKLTLRLTK
jgi:hypothetical protein